jgi:tetraacyldisaccharide 4'-kinase
LNDFIYPSGVGPAGNPDSKLSRCLLPISWVYGLAASLKRSWSSSRARRLSRPVLSIGNITCGGTGKTPTVEMVARDLLGMGLRPAILSRGYRADPTDEGRTNDEFRILGANLPEVPHYQGKDRYARGLEAIERGADVLVLDDGFQHTRLHRDVELVLIDAILPFGHGRVLPSGLLREPLEALSGADLFGITRSDLVSPVALSTLRGYLRRRFPGIPQVLLGAEAVAWVGLTGTSDPPEALRGKRVLAFCGVGNPESFRRQLLGLGVTLAGVICYGDHHRYTDKDLERMEAEAARLDADFVVMTQKDAVKIAPSDGRARWRSLRIRQRILGGREDYERALEGLRQGLKA